LENEFNGYPPCKTILEDSSLHEPAYRKLQGLYPAQLSTGEWVDVSDTNLGDYPGFLGVGTAVVEEVVRRKTIERSICRWAKSFPVHPLDGQFNRDQLTNIDESVRNRLIDLIDEIKTVAAS
jgi:hypothetical protein